MIHQMIRPLSKYKYKNRYQIFKISPNLFATFNIGRLKAICRQTQFEFGSPYVKVPGTSPLGVL